MISAIILAAGSSKRMGQPKMLLSWGETTVLGKVIRTFQEADIEDIIVITGGAHDAVQQVVNQFGARSIFNREFANEEMLFSLKLGLQAQSNQAQATLIGLGDQPQVQAETVRLICEMFKKQKSQLIVPSFQMRRGHPWLVGRSLWSELLEMNSESSPRDFLQRHANDIQYVAVETPSILADLDTMADYRRARP
jgi:molybdenum cofactor cytidylyltransferase